LRSGPGLTVGSLRIILVAALILDVGVVAFLASGGRGISSAPSMTALALGVVLAVGGGIVLFQRKSGAELDRLASDVNAALRAVAERTGLRYDAPPTSAGTANPADRFGEVRGTSAGVAVRVALGSFTSEDLFTTLFFPRRTLSPSASNEVRPLVEQLRNDEEGVTLYLGRTPSWSSSLGLNPMPETDVDRIILVLDRTCQLWRAAADDPSPVPPHQP
jgi:hypothetical protein